MALATNGAPGEIHLNGDLHGSSDPLQPEITPTGVTPGVYNFPNVVVNTKGQILTIEEYAAEDVPCATKVTCGIVKIGASLSVLNGIVDYPGDATAISKGIVQVGSGFSVTNGILAVDYPDATTSTLGVVSVPSSGNLDIDGSGNISVPIATTILNGLVNIPGSDGLVLTAGSLTFDIDTIADTTTSSLGIVQVGSNLTVVSGVLSVNNATSSTLGVVQVGTNLNVVTGLVSNSLATSTTVGVVMVGSGLLVDIAGSVTIDSVDIADATAISKGVVQIGANIGVTSGVISMADGTSAVKGVVNSADTSNISITAGAIDVGSNISQKDTANIWALSQTQNPSTTFDGSITNFFEKTLVSNFELPLISNPNVGSTYDFVIDLDGFVLTFASNYKLRGTTVPFGVTIISCVCISPTEFLTIVQPNFQ